MRNDFLDYRATGITSQIALMSTCCLFASVLKWCGPSSKGTAPTECDALMLTDVRRRTRGSASTGAGGTARSYHFTGVVTV